MGKCGDGLTGVILGVVLVFPACNLLTGLPQWELALLYTAIAAVAEECFFRGLIFPALLPKGRFFSALVTSAAFSLLHLLNLSNGQIGYTLLQMGAAFSVGFALCGVFWRIGKLWPCLLCHLLINLTGHMATSPLLVGLTIFCIFLYAGFGVLLLRKNEV